MDVAPWVLIGDPCFLMPPVGEVVHLHAHFITSVKNEWRRMNVLPEFGLPVAKTEVLTFGS